MPFKDIFVFPNNNPPARFYLHTFGSDEVYGKNAGAAGPIQGAENYVKELLKTKQHVFSDYQFLIGAIWGDVPKNEKVADIFLFRDIEQWPDNPEVTSMIFRNGIHVPRHPIGCGEVNIMLGKEEEFRRETKDLATYMQSNPELGHYRIGGAIHHY